jgi:hypothetical protein
VFVQRDNQILAETMKVKWARGTSQQPTVKTTLVGSSRLKGFRRRTKTLEMQRSPKHLERLEPLEHLETFGVINYLNGAHRLNVLNDLNGDLSYCCLMRVAY